LKLYAQQYLDFHQAITRPCLFREEQEKKQKVLGQ
jgi:hypothetical protein